MANKIPIMKAPWVLHDVLVDVSKIKLVAICSHINIMYRQRVRNDRL